MCLSIIKVMVSGHNIKNKLNNTVSFILIKEKEK
jgi:hypothetical protein